MVITVCLLIDLKQILQVVQSLQDGRKGPCWGYLKDGDVITHLNDEVVNGKDMKEVLELFNSSWKAVFDVDRNEGIVPDVLAIPEMIRQLVYVEE